MLETPTERGVALLIAVVVLIAAVMLGKSMGAGTPIISLYGSPFWSTPCINNAYGTLAQGTYSTNQTPYFMSGSKGTQIGLDPNAGNFGKWRVEIQKDGTWKLKNFATGKYIAVDYSTVSTSSPMATLTVTSSSSSALAFTPMLQTNNGYSLTANVGGQNMFLNSSGSTPSLNILYTETNAATPSGQSQFVFVFTPVSVSANSC